MLSKQERLDRLDAKIDRLQTKIDNAVDQEVIDKRTVQRDKLVGHRADIEAE